MKIKNIAAVLLLIWTCGFSSVVSAAEIQTVQLTEENQLVYTKDKAELAGAFDGMAPGDSRTVVIKIENQNSHKASFFISQKTTDALEEAGKASGGAYEFQVEIGNDTNRTSLLDADAGGYAENVASAEGLAEITELNEYRYMTTLDPGESADVYVTLTLDGEGMDSANGIDYSRAAGAMEFEFRAYYADDRKPVVITNYVTEHGEDNVVTKIVKKVIPKTVTEQLVPLANGVRTGDPLTVTVSAGVLVAGIVIVGIAVVIIFGLVKPISAYQMGETYARNMGVNVKVLRIALILLSSLLSACVTAFAGPISFVGIAVPHLIKLATRTAKPIILIPGCFLGGAAITLFCDGIARTVFAPTEISISSVTAVFLVPVVIAAMLRKQRM